MTCTLGTIASGGSATVSLVVNPPVTPGPVANTASVTSSNPDTQPANNSSTSTVTTVDPAAIPALSTLGLLLLVAMVTLVGVTRLR